MCKIKVKQSSMNQRWQNKMIYGKWVENGRPMKNMHVWYKHIRRNGIKIFENKSWYKTLSYKNVHTDPVVYYFNTDNGIHPYKVYIEHNGFQHLTFECYQDGDFWETAIYPLTDYNNVQMHVDRANYGVRDNRFGKVTLTKYQYEMIQIGDCAFKIRFSLKHID